MVWTIALASKWLCRYLHHGCHHLFDAKIIQATVSTVINIKSNDHDGSDRSLYNLCIDEMVASVVQISAQPLRLRCYGSYHSSCGYTFQNYTKNGVDHSVLIKISVSKFKEWVQPCSCFNENLRNGSHHPPPKISRSQRCTPLCMHEQNAVDPCLRFRKEFITVWTIPLIHWLLAHLELILFF